MIRSSARCLVAAVMVAGLTTPGMAAGWDADQVALHAHMPLSMFSGAEFAEDCWGYVSGSGREYAIIGLSNGTGFVEITDPDNPVVVDIVTTPNRGRDMKVYQHYVYSSSDSGPLHVIDVSDIDNGNITLVDSFPDGATHNLFINEESGFLYLAIGGPLVALDLTDPETPAFAGFYDIETHDVQVVTYNEGQYAGREIAFVSAGRADSLQIIDVTDKGSMFAVGSAGYPGAEYAHQGWLSGDRQYFYLSDELDGIQRTSIFAVGDLANPVHLGDFSSSNPDATDHNLYWLEGFIFEANYSSGLRIFDACDPLAPVEVGYFDTSETTGQGFSGAWSSYPYFPSGTVIVSDRSNGLFILDASEAVGAGCDSVCPADLDGNGSVDFGDILAVLAAWGGSGPEDIDGSGTVDFGDLLLVLGSWGPCP